MIPGSNDFPDNHSMEAYLQASGLESLTCGDARIPIIIRLAETCEYEVAHTHQVTRLALTLFDQLAPLHQLGSPEKFWLEAAALLHDIGWVDGWRRHHKASLRIIMHSSMLPFTSRERLAIGSIARYHRKALPNESHDHFNALAFQDRQVVKMLAAILRVADGLDGNHKQRVKDIEVKSNTRRIHIVCMASCAIPEEEEDALSKGTLMELVMNRKLFITRQADT